MPSAPITRCSLILTVGLAMCTGAFGWSERGHRIVALAAQEQLSDNAKKRMGYLLGRDGRLVDVATWADEQIVTRPETEAWHSITIPPDKDGVDMARDCPLGDCVTAQIRRCVGVIRLAIKPRQEIVDAFKMLVGLAADMHQPVLNGYPPADGKEANVVVLDGVEMSLFDAWDSGILAQMGSDDEILERVRQHIAMADPNDWKHGTYRAWTWETHRITVDEIYPSVASSGATQLDGSSLEEAAEIAVSQLAKSAVRLAHMLDLAWP